MNEARQDRNRTPRAAKPHKAGDLATGREGEEPSALEPKQSRGSRAPQIDHLGIAVRSLDQALEFYARVLGIEGTGRETVPQEKVRVAMLPMGPKGQSASSPPRIELLEATADDSPIARFIAKRGEGLHHVALRVPDLAAAVERLRAAGARLVNENIQTGAGGHRYVFVHPSSAGGVLLELVEEQKEQ